MAAKLKAGIIPSGRLVALKLRQLIEGPNSPTDKTVTLINPFNQTNMASAAGLILSSGTAPTDTDMLWYDTTIEILRQYDGSLWQPFGGRGYIMTNKSGSDLVKGNVAVVDTTTDNSFTLPGLDNDPKVLGVLGEDIDDDATGVIIFSGPAFVTDITGGSKEGKFLTTRNGQDKIQIQDSAITGVFGRILNGVDNIGLLFGQAIL